MLALVAVAAVVVAGRSLGDSLVTFARWVESLGSFGPLVFMAGYALATVAFLPGSFLTLAGGAVFGFWGVAYAFLGASAGACLSFLVARHLARGWVEARIASNPRFAAIDRAIAREGRKVVFLLRLSPVFPFNLLNYALGLTRIRFVDYLVACLGMLPGAFLYVYYGKAAGDLATLASDRAGDEHGAGHWVFLAVGLAATVAVTALVTRLARTALAEATGAVSPDDDGSGHASRSKPPLS